MQRFGGLFKGVLAGLIVTLASFVFAIPAGAGTALPGSTFAISYLKLGPGEVPGADSGISGMGYSSPQPNTNGRFTLFTSNSDNLAAGLNRETGNLFRKDNQSGNVVLVSRADGINGPAIAGAISGASMSGNGNLVAIVTQLPVAAEDSDDKFDIYLRNIKAGTTKLLTGAINQDCYDVDLSADGSHLAFVTPAALVPGDVNGDTDVYRLRLSDSTIEIVSATNGTSNAGNRDSREPSISGDGAWVAFSSRAGNMVPGFVENNGLFDRDVFIRNMADDTTHLVSARFNDAVGSGNGSAEEPDLAGAPGALAAVKVAFTGYSTDHADNGVSDPEGHASIYLREMDSVASRLVSRASGPAGANADSRAHTPSISDDASRIIFTSDAQNLGPPPDYYGVYLRNLDSSSTSLVSYDNSYAVFGLISGDGSTGAWGEAGGATADSDPDLSSVYVRKLPSGQIRLASRPKGSKRVRAPGFRVQDDRDRVLSANGRYFVFSAYSSRLPGTKPGVWFSQVYRRDLKTGKVELVSRANGPNGAVSTGADEPSVSSNGNLVTFRTSGPLDPADTNDLSDVYVRNIAEGTTNLVSRADGPGGAIANNGGDRGIISGNGQRVAFVSDSANLGTDGAHDYVIVRDLVARTTAVASRGDGEAGVLANGNSSYPSLSFDGSKVIYGSSATNLDPADVNNAQSVYLRDIQSHETSLVSRRPGPAGASVSGSIYTPAISGNGARVAFSTEDVQAAPDTAPWPAGRLQLVVRNLADGSNQLASISSGGEAGDEDSADPSFSRSGNIIAFETDATNLRDGYDNTDSETVVIRDLTTGTVAGPPRFGLSPTGSSGSQNPSVSDNGNCVSFQAHGYNDLTGPLGDFRSAYLYVRNASCVDPRTLVPKLRGVRLNPVKFRVAPKGKGKASAKKRRTPRGARISFRLNTRARLTILVDRKVEGRRVGKKCVKVTRKNQGKKRCSRLIFRGRIVRKNVAPGKRKIRFTGRIKGKALKPGKYRMRFQANTAGDRSNRPVRPFRIVKR